MKKTILFLGLLGFASSAQAQGTPNLGPWVQVNMANFGTFAPGYRIERIATVSATQAWAVAQENTASGKSNTFLLTNNAAGTEFDFGGITAIGANSNFETTNIAPVGASVTTAIAGNYPPTGSNPAGGGEILRTTNAGISWTKVLTFANTSTSFLDFVYMFNANQGVAVGDPAGGYYEIYTTADGGVTWTRVPQANIPALKNANEYALVNSYFGMSNGTFWFAGASSDDTDPIRIFKSTNFGQNWTVSPNTTLTGNASRLVFKDANNGIAYNVKLDASNTNVVAVNMIRTSDGGVNWSPITPNNTATGSFFRYDIDAVNGYYYSVGVRFPASTPAVAADFGSSLSTDGVNWTNLNNSQGFFTVDLIASGTTNNAVGYAGAATDPVGMGGMYKVNTVISSARNSALQSTLSVYPNPSTNGVFNVDLGSDLKAGATLSVADALGRTVKTQTLSATAIGSKMLNLDLSGEKSGIYTLQIRTQAGIATQKIVID